MDRDGLLGEGGRKEATLLRAKRTVETGAAQAGRGGKATGGNPRALGRGASWWLGSPPPLPCFIFLLSIYRNLSGYPFYQASTKLYILAVIFCSLPLSPREGQSGQLLAERGLGLFCSLRILGACTGQLLSKSLLNE